MVSPGRRHLQGLARPRLSRHVRQVRGVPLTARGGRGQPGAEARARDHEPGEHRVRAPPVVDGLVGHRFVAEDRDELAQAPDAEDRDARHQGGLPGRLLGDDDLLVSGLGRREDGRQHPRTGRTRPSSPSSPIITTSAMAAGSSRSAAPSTAHATARSKPEPLFGTEAGERPTVSFFCGHSAPELTTAARTRSRLSIRLLSGSPTSVNAATPGSRSASTSTTTPSTPTSATEHARAYPIRTPPAHAR